MEKDTQNLSRRNFLSKGAVAATAAASIIVIETPIGANAATVGEMTPALFDCNNYQVLKDKIISSTENILGTDQVNVREYSICGTDITDALNAAINSLKNSGGGTNAPRGGQILIPRGKWTTRGGHKYYPSVSIEGVGTQLQVGFYGVPWGTELHLVADENEEFSDYMFMIDTLQHNCTLKNLTVNLGNSSAIGILMTNEAVSASHIKHTVVENVTFAGGDYGIKVDSKPYGENNPSFECVMTQFKRLIFYGCNTSFWCNTINSGFLFDTCHFLLPDNGIALHLETVGNISVEHCFFVPTGAQLATGSIILKTEGVFNSISFYDCQDENVEYAYRNTNNPWDHNAIVYRNCLIQSKFKFTTHGSVVLDSCKVYSKDEIGGAFEDSYPDAAVKVHLKGKYNFFRWVPTIIYSGAPIANFSHHYSRVFIEAEEVGEPVILPATASEPAPPNNYRIDSSRGLIIINPGTLYLLVYNNLVTEDSMVFAQLHTVDSGGARITHVACLSGYFYICLSAPAANKLRVAFKVEV